MSETTLTIETPVGPLKIIIDSKQTKVGISYDNEIISSVHYDAHSNKVVGELWKEKETAHSQHQVQHSIPPYAEDHTLERAYYDVEHIIQSMEDYGLPIYDIPKEDMQIILTDVRDIDASSYNDEVQYLIERRLDPLREEYYDRALETATKAHNDQKDLAGAPYINHVKMVSEIAGKLDTTETSKDTEIVGLLHDLFEDTSVTPYQLRECGYPELIIEAIDQLSRPSFRPYSEYIDKITNPLARYVKMADLIHNMDLSRMPENYKPSSGDKARIRKYQRALETLAKDEDEYIRLQEIYKELSM